MKQLTANYILTLKRAKEIFNDKSLEEAKSEAKVMKAAFEAQGNKKHSIAMSPNKNLAIVIDKAYELVKTEYNKLI